MLNIPLLQKIRQVLGQEILDNLIVKLRFCNIDPTALNVVGQDRRELSPNEAHSYAYLLHHEEVSVTKKEMQAKVNDLRSHGYYSDPLMPFEKFSANVDSVLNTACYLRRCEGFAELVLEIQGVELAQSTPTSSVRTT